MFSCKTVCFGLYIDKPCGILSESPDNTDSVACPLGVQVPLYLLIFCFVDTDFRQSWKQSSWGGNIGWYKIPCQYAIKVQEKCVDKKRYGSWLLEVIKIHTYILQIKPGKWLEVVLRNDILALILAGPFLMMKMMISMFIKWVTLKKFSCL